MTRIYRALARNNWPYAVTNPILVSIGVFACLTGLTATACPELLEGHPLGVFLPPLWQAAWPLAHLIGGSFLLWGVFTRRPQFEAAGCVSLSFTYAAQCASVLVVVGLPDGFVPVITLVALVVGLVLRACLLAWAGSRY